MVLKRIVIGIVVIVVVAIAAFAYWFFQLTAPVQVSQAIPIAPTLAVRAQQANTSQTGASANTNANATGTPATESQALPSGTPGAGRGRFNGTPPPGGFRGGFNGTPPPGGFPRFNGTPPAGGFPGFNGTPPPGGFPGGPGGPGGFDNGPASTAPPEAPTVAAASGGSEQVYRIDASQSKASYGVSETFFQDYFGQKQGTQTTVGTTKAIAGDILVDKDNPAASKLGEIVVDISQLKSDVDMRDNAIRRQWLESVKYPLATFSNTQVTGLPSAWTQGQAVQFKIEGDLTIHGTTKQVTWEATATLNGNTLQIQATTDIKMSDFGVQAPDMGVLSVKDDAQLTLDLVANAVGS